MADASTHLRTVANDDGAAILNLREGTISTLNVTGAYVWEALKRGQPSEAIIAGLVEKTEEPKELIERDVRDFLSALEEHKLVEL